MSALPMVGAPARAVTALTLRQVRRPALIVAVLAGGMSALVASTYRSTVGSEAQVAALAALAENPAIRTLFGVSAALDDAGGFTVWRTGTVLAVLLGMWGLLAATRLTRGEEDSGRLDLLLAGRVTRGRLAGLQLTLLTAAMGLVGAAIAAALTAAGTDADSAMLHGVGMALLGTVFVGVGGLAAQVFAGRAAATGAAAAVLGAGLLARMVGDGVDSLGWLRWLTPFGQVELTGPYHADRWWPVLLLAVEAGALLAVVPAAAAGRDVRGGWLPSPGGRPARTALLGSVAGFAVRRMLRPLAGWCVGAVAYYLLIGLVARSLTQFLTANPEFAELAAQAGVAGLGTVEGYAATLFALLAVPVGVFTAVRIAAFAADERDRRLTLLLSGPVTHRSAACAEVAAAVGGAVLLTAVCGLATWAGTTVVGADLSLGDALAGTANVLPVVALCMGAAVLALGVAPSAVAWIGAFPATGGFLLRVIADSIGAPGWVARMSPFAHLAPVPQVAPDWPGAVGMTLLAGVLFVLGLHAYARRDVQG